MESSSSLLVRLQNSGRVINESYAPAQRSRYRRSKQVSAANYDTGHHIEGLTDQSPSISGSSGRKLLNRDPSARVREGIPCTLEEILQSSHTITSNPSEPIPRPVSTLLFQPSRMPTLSTQRNLGGKSTAPITTAPTRWTEPPTIAQAERREPPEAEYAAILTASTALGNPYSPPWPPSPLNPSPPPNLQRTFPHLPPAEIPSQHHHPLSPTHNPLSTPTTGPNIDISDISDTFDIFAAFIHIPAIYATPPTATPPTATTPSAATCPLFQLSPLSSDTSTSSSTDTPIPLSLLSSNTCASSNSYPPSAFDSPAAVSTAASTVASPEEDGCGYEVGVKWDVDVRWDVWWSEDVEGDLGQKEENRGGGRGGGGAI
ncbi:hypothetical protein MMC17_007997 [Xylographa soralifera]|nr:hypothetical protein [Xylographa soralifera]